MVGSRARISTATLRSLLSEAAKIDLILPHSQDPLVGGQSKGTTCRAPPYTAVASRPADSACTSGAMRRAGRIAGRNAAAEATVSVTKS